MEAVTCAFGSPRAGFLRRKVGAEALSWVLEVALQGTRRKLRKNALKSGRGKENEKTKMEMLAKLPVFGPIRRENSLVTD